MPDFAKRSMLGDRTRALPKQPSSGRRSGTRISRTFFRGADSARSCARTAPAAHANESPPCRRNSRREEAVGAIRGLTLPSAPSAPVRQRSCRASWLAWIPELRRRSAPQACRP